MLINEFGLSGIAAIGGIPITQLMLKTLVVSIVIFAVLKFVMDKSKLLMTILTICAATLFIYYFGLVALGYLLIICLGAILLGFKIFKFDEFAPSLIVGLFSLLELYIIAALLLDFKIAFAILLATSFALIGIKRKQNKKILRSIKLEFNTYLRSINIIDIWIIISAFAIGSLPQSHWDAVHANLYNAKWYILGNSFTPIVESISSLFPQNAIGYYSLFYQIGTYRVLQIAYLLPLVILLFIYKNISLKLKFSKLAVFIGYLIIFTPIVIFQSSSGYYDLLVTLTLVSAVYILYFQVSKNTAINTLSAAFLIGFGAAIKYFPLFFILLPIIGYILNKKSGIRNILVISLASVAIGIFPLAIWMLRAYSYTGSPVFPFFQSIFPTPEIWSGGELEQNFMIQTVMDVAGWIKGGFFIYPILTYLKTESYIEATRGYSGIFYIFLLPIQVLIFISIARRFINRKLQNVDVYYLYSFAAYICMGVVARYYRYVWPFQFVFSLITIFYLAEVIDKKKIKAIILWGVVILVFVINFNDVLGYFRFSPIVPEQLYKPNYLLETTSKPDNPILFLNDGVIGKREVILDVSNNILPRFHFKSRVYECNWYWINGVTEMAKAKESASYAKRLIGSFDYVVASNPIAPVNNFCYQVIEDNQDLLIEVYRDDAYLVFKVK